MPIHENPSTDTDDVDEMDVTRMELIDFSRPSDYLTKAVQAKKSGHSTSSGDDAHLESSLSRGSKTSKLTQNGSNPASNPALSNTGRLL